MGWKGNNHHVHLDGDRDISNPENGWTTSRFRETTTTWRLWRHCCCRYGWYPLLMAPLVTVGCVLSLYSASGCDFMQVNVGFTPSNDVWNESSIDLGLFLYQSGDVDASSYSSPYLKGCRRYSDEFTDSFISGDRTWKVARIMAYVAGGASILATIIIWLFVVSPLPASPFWPGIVLPCLMASFLAEGSKFLFFDTAICHMSLWYPPGEDSLPLPAESCTLGATGKFALASATVFLLSLLVGCFRHLEKRELDPNYGLEMDKDVGGSRQYSHRDSYHEPTSEDYMDTASEHDHFEVVRHIRSEDVGSQLTSNSRGLDSEYDSGVENGLSNSIRGDFDDDDELLSHRMDSLDPDLSGDRYTDGVMDVEEGDGDGACNPQNNLSSSLVVSNNVRPMISESRLSTIERMQMNSAGQSESELIIDQLVNELNESFRVISGQKSRDDSSRQLTLSSSGGCLIIQGTTTESNAFQTAVACGNDESDQPIR